MEIVLCRHGKPGFQPSGWVSARRFADGLKRYDEAPLDLTHPPEADALPLVQGCGFTVCSHLRRSIHSAEVLGVETVGRMDPLFREFEMPYHSWRWPLLPASAWRLLFRCGQLLGYSPNAESLSAFKARSEACTEQLIDLAAQHESVLFIGHGMLLWLIHRQLQRRGWMGQKRSPRHYWQYGVYRPV